nr:hypothetical protein [uncultured Mogibacterium sp.]
MIKERGDLLLFYKGAKNYMDYNVNRHITNVMSCLYAIIIGLKETTNPRQTYKGIVLLFKEVMYV